MTKIRCPHCGKMIDMDMVLPVKEQIEDETKKPSKVVKKPKVKKVTTKKPETKKPTTKKKTKKPKKPSTKKPKKA